VTAVPLVGRPLERHEHQYLALVAQHLRDVDRSTRAVVLGVASDHLTDRPATRDEQELHDALGSPSEYATELRTAHALGPERNDWWARWIAISMARRCIGVLSALLLVTTTIAGVATYRWWVNWEAGVYSSSFGVRYATGDPFAGITRVETFDSRQTTVPFDATRQLDLEVLLLTDRDVRIEHIGFPDEFSTTPIRLVDVDVSPAVGVRDWQPFAPFSLGREGAFIRLRFTFENCEAWQPATAVIYGHVEIDYDALGRNRHAAVSLISLLAIEMTACPT
jgi:hypothetical protein